MSYSIIFQTKIVNLPDGRIIHFSRNGCNNDDCGRDKNGYEFTGKIYNKKDFIQYAENFKVDSAPYKESGNFELKIGSRCASCYDYGEHLLRMMKRAENYSDFIKKHCFRSMYCKGVHIIKPENKWMTLDEFVEMPITSEHGMVYSYEMEYPNKIEEIVNCLENGIEMQFCIK